MATRPRLEHRVRISEIACSLSSTVCLPRSAPEACSTSRSGAYTSDTDGRGEWSASRSVALCSVHRYERPYRGAASSIRARNVAVR